MTPAGEELNFRLGDFKTDGDGGGDARAWRCYFVGITPDMFKAEGGSDVIVEGQVSRRDVHAQSVLTSCPSKYEAEATGAPAARASRKGRTW